jgi:GNAT superfamily N-acetyltransferase
VVPTDAALPASGAMECRIEWLADHLELVDTVVGWHWREWSHGEPDASLAAWRARLVTRGNRDCVPFTLVAFSDNDPVGCVSVCEDDVDARFPLEGPWISGMFVVGLARDQGVGRMLVRAAEDRARDFGAVRLWLWTTEAAAFYRRCGWESVVSKQALADATVMRRTL